MRQYFEEGYVKIGFPLSMYQVYTWVILMHLLPWEWQFPFKKA